MSKAWMRGEVSAPVIDHGSGGGDLQSLAFKIRLKAMHHWIKKGNGDRAYLVARDLAHQINFMIRVGRL